MIVVLRSSPARWRWAWDPGREHRAILARRYPNAGDDEIRVLWEAYAERDRRFGQAAARVKARLLYSEAEVVDAPEDRGVYQVAQDGKTHTGPEPLADYGLDPLDVLDGERPPGPPPELAVPVFDREPAEVAVRSTALARLPRLYRSLHDESLVKLAARRFDELVDGPEELLVHASYRHLMAEPAHLGAIVELVGVAECDPQCRWNASQTRRLSEALYNEKRPGLTEGAEEDSRPPFRIAFLRALSRADLHQLTPSRVRRLQQVARLGPHGRKLLIRELA